MKPETDMPSALLQQLSKGTTDWALSIVPFKPPPTPEDDIARRAVAAVEIEDGYERSAQHRLHGAYDDGHEHRIALKAIELFKQSIQTRKQR